MEQYVVRGHLSRFLWSHLAGWLAVLCAVRCRDPAAAAAAAQERELDVSLIGTLER
jgi:hypothetical protein